MVLSISRLHAVIFYNSQVYSRRQHPNENACKHRVESNCIAKSEKSLFPAFRDCPLFIWMP